MVDATKYSDADVDWENLAEMFVEDFLTLEIKDVINKWRKYGGTHPLPPSEIIIPIVRRRDIGLFLSDIDDVERMKKEKSDGLILIRDVEESRSGFSLLRFQGGEYQTGRLMSDENEAKEVFMEHAVMFALSWDYNPK